MSDRIYFVSDIHCTYHTEAPEERKKRSLFLDFLSRIRGSQRLYLVGDTFEFWFEYRNAVPRYYGDILFGLKALRESGTEIFITGGNHDYWFGSYLPENIGITVLPPLTTHLLQNKRITVSHGDTLLPGDYGYKVLKTIIRSRAVIALSRLIHPDILYPLAGWFSLSGKDANLRKTERFARIMCERAADTLFRWENDVFVMGHIHLPVMKRFGKRVFIILGDWETHFSYLRLEGGELFLEYYRPDENTLMENR